MALDFYLIPNDQAEPEDRGRFNLERVGGLELSTFNRLQRQGVINANLDFYCDFRWSNFEIKEMIFKLNSNNTEHLEFKKILEKANPDKYGLISVAD